MSILIVGNGAFSVEISEFVLSGVSNFTDCQTVSVEFWYESNSLLMETYVPLVYVFAIGSSKFRGEHFEKRKRESLGSLFIGNQTISRNAQVGNANIILGNVSIAANSSVGSNCHIHANTVIGHDVIIGDSVTIGANCFIGGGCIIGNGATIHPGSSIIPNMTIGKESTIGVGSVVIKDVPERRTVFGNPARLIF